MFLWCLNLFSILPFLAKKGLKIGLKLSNDERLDSVRKNTLSALSSTVRTSSLTNCGT